MSGAHELLVEMLGHHYRWLGEATRDMDLDKARHTPSPGRPSPAWIVAHLADCADSVAEAVLARPRWLPPGFATNLARPDVGLCAPADWVRLREAWEELSRGVLEGLARLPPEVLESPPAVPIAPAFRARLTSRRAFLIGHVFHVAYHLGQLGSARASLGLGWGEHEASGA